MEQLLLDSLDMACDLIIKLKEFAREIFCEEEPVLRPERALKLRPHQIPQRRAAAHLIRAEGREMEIILCLLLLLEQLLAACIEGTKE